jgi:hypothetical protein
MARIAFVFMFALVLGACSTVMEYNRPEPVDLSQFITGERRLDVIKVLGPPLASVNDAGKSCDVYHLYTHGVGGAGKAGIIFAEGVADVFTLGLAEVVTTPTESATKSQLHPVTMCYGQDSLLVSVEESDQAVVEGQQPSTTMNVAAPAAPASDTSAPAAPTPAVVPDK